MILHLSRMRRKVNRKVYNNRKNVSATTPTDIMMACENEYSILGSIQLSLVKKNLFLPSELSGQRK